MVKLAKILVLVRNPRIHSLPAYPIANYPLREIHLVLEAYRSGGSWVKACKEALKDQYQRLDSYGWQGDRIVIACENETIFNIARAITAIYSDVWCMIQDDEGEVITQPLEGGRMEVWPHRPDFFVNISCLKEIMGIFE